MTTRDEMLKTFRTLEEPAIKERLDNMREISDRLIGELGGISPRIDLGDKPVIVVTESITPTELMEMCIRDRSYCCQRRICHSSWFIRMR